MNSLFPNQRNQASPHSAEHMRAIAAIGGSVTSAKKAAACRANANRPCAPGKGRGRPFHKKPHPPQP